MKKVVLVIISALFLDSCAPIYIPNAVNSPLFSEQHDAALQGSSGLSGYDVQAAYSPLKHFGIMFNTSFYDNKSSDLKSYNRHEFYEGGAGYYGSFEEVGRYEVYSGFGQGTSTSYDSNWLGLIRGDYNRFFVQPAIGVKTDVFEGSFSPRFVYLQIYNTSSNVTYTKSELESMYIEPVFTGKVGYKYGKFFFQGGFSFSTKSEIKYTDMPFIFNLGMNISFSKLYLKEKDRPAPLN